MTAPSPISIILITARQNSYVNVWLHLCSSQLQLVWWQNWNILVYPVLRHVQCFIAYSDRTNPTDCKSAECKVSTLEELVLLTKFKMATIET